MRGPSRETGHATGGPSVGAPVRCLAVVGPTATGKTRLAVQLARALGGEVVSADSRQVYRRMDIGTGKDVAEYGSGEARVPVHMIDVAEPGEAYDLYRYVLGARARTAECRDRGVLPVLAGGSHLYVNALIRNHRLEGVAPNPEFRRRCEGRTDEELTEQLRALDPAVHARTDVSKRKRIIRGLEIARTPSEGRKRAPSLPLAPLLLGPYYPRSELHRRIESRLDERLASGLLDEVRSLHAEGVSWERLEFLGLEYRFAARHLCGDLDFDAFRSGLLAGIRHLCRAQEIWLRKLEREGWDIHWVSKGNPEEALRLARRFLDGDPLPPPVIRLNETLYGPRTQ